tara:strand:- start:4873 stop:5121 length:249 start_codon:yes stop_codon:yes gene_type:complete
MCVGRRPSPPPLPEPRPTPPKPEQTAQRVLVGTNRPSVSGQQTTTTGGRKRTGQRQSRARRLGTAMLRIPLNPNQSTSDLRY